MGEALSMGWCLAMIQKSLLWTIVGNMLRENHALSKLNTSFVDLEIEWAGCNCCKENVPLQYFFRSSSSSHTIPQSNVGDSVDPQLRSVKRRWLGWPTPSIKSNVVDSVDPHLPAVKRRRLGWPSPSLSQTASNRLTHTFPHFYVILYWTCSRPEYR